jgi:hypothetical protein
LSLANVLTGGRRVTRIFFWLPFQMSSNAKSKLQYQKITLKLMQSMIAFPPVAAKK